MISWIARRSLRRWRGLLMPISRWISVSDRADMMAPLFTLARHAATYHAGIPTHSWERHRSSTHTPSSEQGCFPYYHTSCLSCHANTNLWFVNAVEMFSELLYLEPHHDGGSVPLSERQTLPTGFLQQFMSENTEGTLWTGMCVQRARMMICTHMKQSYGQRTARED